MAEPDPDRLKRYSFTVFSQLSGAVTAGMIHLGDKLGLYAALGAADEPLTSQELADRAGLAERWVREWASNQAAAHLVEFTADDEGTTRYSLSPEGRAVTATPDHQAFGMGMFHRFPGMMAALDEMPQCFETGVGRDYDSHGPEGAIGIERSFEPWNRHHLLPTVLPELDGLVDRLTDGASVADVGCGAGGALLMLADAFPASSFAGYDISHYALQRAEERRRAAGADNVRFLDPRVDPLPQDGSLDFVTTFDCIHDMTDPAGMMHAIRDALGDDGTWLLVDIKGRDSLEENIEKNPMAALMYGVSVLSCMSSALSAPDGAGLGTLGLPESVAQQMAEDAGFTRFRRLPIDHAINAFYEVRP
jgi:SAM-dependent methyltransferase